MKNYLKILSVFLLISLVNTGLQAQEEEVTTEDLRSYARLITMVDSMKSAAKDNFVALIRQHELMDGGRRFNALKKAWGNETALSEAGATEEEKAAYSGIIEAKSQAGKDITAKFSEVVKSTLGARKYNKIKKGIKSDPEMKAEYDAILSEMTREEDTEAEETN